jgi:clan AA aspartic protease
MLTLRNPRSPQSDSVDVEALADTGAVYLIIPEHIRLQLALEESSEKEITLADGSKKMVPSVGPIETKFKNRVAYVGAVVMGDEVLLGAIPMEERSGFYHSKKSGYQPLNPPLLRRRGEIEGICLAPTARFSFEPGQRPRTTHAHKPALKARFIQKRYSSIVPPGRSCLQAAFAQQS